MAVLLWISRQSTYDSRQVWNSVIACGQKDPHRNWFKVTFVFFWTYYSRYFCFYLWIFKSFESEFFICWSNLKAKAIRLGSMTPSWLVPASVSHCKTPQHRCKTLRCQNLLWLARIVLSSEGSVAPVALPSVSESTPTTNVMNDGRNLFIWLIAVAIILLGLAVLETALEVPQI